MASPIRVGPSELPTTVGVVHTCVADTEITHILVTNRTNGALTLSLHVVPRGASTANGNKILGDLNVPANDLIEFHDLGIALAAGDVVWGVASGAGVNVALRVIDNRESLDRQGKR